MSFSHTGRHDREPTRCSRSLNANVATRPRGLWRTSPWTQDFKPLLKGARENVVDIVGIAFTEMLNNAIDHSESEETVVKMVYTAAMITVRILDGGVGVFRKVKEEKNLIDERHAILELAKGRLTTAPEHHSGMGIYFTSRMVDIFSMASGDLFFTPHPTRQRLAN